MTYTPQPIVEIAFGFSEFDNPPGDDDWTDVSQWCKSATPLRGSAGAEFSDPSPGTCTFVFDNSQRTFDPTYVDGPFFGLLVPDVPIRIRAVIG